MDEIGSFLVSRLSEFSTFEVTVVVLNVVLLVFAKPLFRVLSPWRSGVQHHQGPPAYLSGLQRVNHSSPAVLQAVSANCRARLRCVSRREVVICGAGIAGVAAAYFLSVRHGVKDIVLVDERSPLSLTSDKSTECYRNWWPGPGDSMVGLMNRSIDLLEEIADESANRINLNRRGYLFATAEEERIEQLMAAGEEAGELGAGELRCHEHSSGHYQPSAASSFSGHPIEQRPASRQEARAGELPLSQSRDGGRFCMPGVAAGSALSSSVCTCWRGRVSRVPVS